MSLERRNNSEGYSRKNCVLVASEFNTGDWSRHKGVRAESVKGSAQWSRWRVQDVPRLRQLPTDGELLSLDIKEALLGPSFKKHEVVRNRLPVKEETGCIYCSHLFTYVTGF